MLRRAGATLTRRLRMCKSHEDVGSCPAHIIVVKDRCNAAAKMAASVKHLASEHVVVVLYGLRAPEMDTWLATYRDTLPDTWTLVAPDSETTSH